MILTTTNSIQGKEISKYLNIISATTYCSNLSGKVLSFRDAFNKEKTYDSYEQGLENGKRDALEKLKLKAQEEGATAVVGITIDIETVSQTFLAMISVTGTAVFHH